MRAISRPELRTWHFLGLILLLQAGLTFLDATPRAQCAIGVIPAWLAFRLVSGPGDRRCGIVAFVTACVCIIEPLALTYQRFILADSLGLFMTAAALFLCMRVIDRSPRAIGYAALAPLFIILAASLRASQVPSLVLLCVFVLSLLFLVYRDYATGAILLVSLIICQTVFSGYAIENQGAPGYNAASGRFMLGPCCPSFRAMTCNPTSTRPGRRPFWMTKQRTDERGRMNCFSRAWRWIRFTERKQI
jgi:hypothetical protein